MKQREAGVSITREIPLDSGTARETGLSGIYPRSEQRSISVPAVVPLTENRCPVVHFGAPARRGSDQTAGDGVWLIFIIHKKSGQRLRLKSPIQYPTH